MRSERTEALRRSAQMMLHRDGYARFGYSSVAEAFGITRSAVQQALGKKDDLVLGLLSDAKADLEIVMERILAAAEPKHYKLVEEFLSSSLEEYDRGLPMCIMASVVANYDVLPDAVRRGADALTSLLVTQLALAIEDGRNRGIYRFCGTAEDQANLVIATVRGARLLARQRGRHALTSALDALLDSLRTASD